MASAKWPSLFLICVALATSCSGQSGRTLLGEQADLPASPRNGIPAPSQLPRGVSSIAELDGLACQLSQGAQPSLTEAGLQLRAPAVVESPFKGAFAIYVFNGLARTPATVRLELKSQFKADCWVGLASWKRNCWDWTPGAFKASPTLAPSDYEGQPGEYLSLDGRFAIVVVLNDDIEPVIVKKLKITTTDEIESLTATDSRWDGIRLDWSGPAEADGYRIFRRPAGSADWQAAAGITGQPLDGFEDHYRDIVPPANAQYEYLVQAGFHLPVLGEMRWFWSAGLTAVGSRAGWATDGTSLGATSQFAVNLGNRLSFFYTPGGSTSDLQILSAGTYPALNEWTHYGPGDGGMDTGPLSTSQQFLPAPVAVLSESTTNNPLVTTGYSNADGAFIQVATIDQQNQPLFETPVRLRESESDIHILGLTKVPIKSIMALLWNGNANRLELMQSFDEFGRVWFVFDPEQAPWQIVTNQVPEGRVDLRVLGFPIYVSFAEQSSHTCVVMYLNDGWHNVSPGITCAPGPQSRGITMEGFQPAKALLYTTEDRSQIRVLRNVANEWQLGDGNETVAVQAPTGSSIGEFDSYTLGEQSFDNYLVYTIAGQLFFSHSSDSPLRMWSEPILLDPATDCHDVQILLNGSDENSTTYLVATYLSQDASGITRINFRDLRLAYEEAKSDG